MKRLEALSYYFKGGQSESEKNIMNEIFVLPKYIKDITDFSLQNYKVVIGPKGSGKSLVIDYLNEYYLNSNIIALIIRPKDLDIESINSKKIVSEKVKEAKKQIYESISLRIGEGIDFSLTETEEYFKALSKAAKPKSTAKKIGEFVTELVPENYKGLVNAFIKLQSIDTTKFQVNEEVSKYLTGNSRQIMILVDDLDKAVEETEMKFQYASSWAILEAAIEIANEIETSSVLITVRTDIWYLMTKVQKLGTSIYDKIGDPYNLLVVEDWLANVFQKRIKLCYRKAESNPKQAYEYDYFFKPAKIGFYGKNEITRTWEQWMAKNTRNRPRDMIRLMKILIGEAKKESEGDLDTKITDKMLHNILQDYARERVGYIKQEYIQIFPKIDEVIYRLKKTRYTFGEIREYLTSICGIGLVIDGIPINSNSESDKFKILKILHMASVINPRIDKTDGSYEHILFEDDNDFIDPNNISKLQNIVFQVHPTFHSLITKTDIVRVIKRTKN